MARYKGGDVIHSTESGKRWEVQAVGETVYFVRALFSAASEPQERCWSIAECEAATGLEWAQGETALSKELLRLQGESHQYRTAFRALIRRLDRSEEGGNTLMLERVAVQCKLWYKGLLQPGTAIQAIYDEVVRDLRTLPEIDDLRVNHREKTL